MALGSADGVIWSTDDFKNNANGSFSNWKWLVPGDIIIHYPAAMGDESYFSDRPLERSHHVFIYIGTPTHDVKLTWLDGEGGTSFKAIDNETGEEFKPANVAEEVAAGMGAYHGDVSFEATTYITLKAGEPVFVDCTRLDQTGNIYLRGAYEGDGNEFFYYADNDFVATFKSASNMYYKRPAYNIE